MEIFISIALLIVGAVIGFFAAKYWYGKGASKTSVEQAEQELKALLAQQAEHHVFQSRQFVDGVEKQCRDMREQLDNYEKLLTPNQTEAQPAVPFYGEHASNYLRNTLNRDAKLHKASSTDTQPRDFAAAGSGLFVGQAEQVVEKEPELDKGTK